MNSIVKIGQFSSNVSIFAIVPKEDKEQADAVCIPSEMVVVPIDDNKYQVQSP